MLQKRIHSSQFGGSAVTAVVGAADFLQLGVSRSPLPSKYLTDTWGPRKIHSRETHSFFVERLVEVEVEVEVALK